MESSSVELVDRPVAVIVGLRPENVIDADGVWKHYSWQRAGLYPLDDVLANY